MKKMPTLKRLHDQDASRLTVLGINFDDDSEVCERAVEKLDLPWMQNHGVSSRGEHVEAWSQISKISTLPRLLLVHPQGILIRKVSPLQINEIVEDELDK